jgi:hypothetical protein
MLPLPLFSVDYCRGAGCRESREKKLISLHICAEMEIPSFFFVGILKLLFRTLTHSRCSERAEKNRKKHHSFFISSLVCFLIPHCQPSVVM